MIKFYISIILLLLISLYQKVHSQSSEEIIKQRSINWMHALEQNDSAELQNFLASEYTLGGVGDGKYVNRATWLKNALERNWSNTNYHFLDVHMKGNNTAIVNSKMSFKVAPIPFTINSNIIDHWTYRDGRWQVTARFIGGDSITSIINGAIGFLFGTTITLLLVWLVRLSKRRHKKHSLARTNDIKE